MLQLITDSSADLPKEILKKYNISVVPMKIFFEGKEYLEGIQISSQEFFKKMFTSEKLPKTSQPSPLDFANVYKKLSTKGEILCLTISSGLSGTYKSACLGKEISNTEVIVFDTLAGSLGHGLQIIKAAELIYQGINTEVIIEKLKQYRDAMNIIILLDTLDNIIKGGRLSRF